MNADDVVLTGGGVGAFLVAFWYTARFALEALREYRDRKRDQRDVHDDFFTRPVTNAATANEMLLSTLAAIKADRDDLAERVTRTELEARRASMRAEVLTRRTDEHDREIAHLKRRFALAITYIRALLAFIAAHDLSDSAPPPPDGLHIDPLKEQE